MPGSTTALSRTGARNNAPTRVAFRQRYGVGAQNDVDFAAQWLAYAIQKALSQAGGIADVSETPLSLTSQINWSPTMGKELQPLAFESHRGDTQDTDTMQK